MASPPAKNQPKPHREFISLAAADIAAIVQQHQRPRVGVFVPDGTRRLGLALADGPPGTDGFLTKTALLSLQYAQDNLRVFFDHGLATLLVPIFSKSVLGRGQRYQQLIALTILETLFKSEAWQAFYRAYGIRVGVYGEKDFLTEVGCSQALAWIATTEAATARHQQHTLLYGIGGDSWVGSGLSELGIRFFQEHGRPPRYEEQVTEYYGQFVESADFFMMSTKLSGAGAMPPLICDAETAFYFLAAPGVWSLTPAVYKEILCDLLFNRPAEAGTGQVNRQTLEDFYHRHRTAVIGLGHVVGGTWVPAVE